MPARRWRPISSIRYQVGGASWVPFYDARLATGTKAQAPKLQLVRRASIQQRSGESWDNVALALSTARPGAGTAAPDLQPMTVDYEADSPPPRPMASPSGGGTQHVARGGRPGQSRGRADGEDAQLRAKAAPEPPAGRGAARQRRDAGLPGRLSHRRPRHRADHRRGQARADRRDRSSIRRSRCAPCPSATQKAFLYAKMTMARGTPILPGQVSLFRDGTFVGNGRLPLLAPGEEHELGFGVDDAVRVKHAIAEEKRAETGIITSSKTDTRNYRITVKNLHERPIPGHRHRPDPGVAERRHQDRADGQDRADQARRRRQARRARLGDGA